MIADTGHLRSAVTEWSPQPLGPLQLRLDDDSGDTHTQMQAYSPPITCQCISCGRFADAALSMSLACLPQLWEPGRV